MQEAFDLLVGFWQRSYGEASRHLALALALALPARRLVADGCASIAMLSQANPTNTRMGFSCRKIEFRQEIGLSCQFVGCCISRT